MKKTRLLILAVGPLALAAAFAVPAFAQEQPPTINAVAHIAKAPAEPGKPLPASLESTNAILKAEHELDVVKNDLADISQQFNNLQRQADTLTPRFKEDTAKQAAAQAKVDAALEAVWKANGYSKDKYNFDPANFTFTEKPPAPSKADSPAPAPAKTTTAANTPAK